MGYYRMEGNERLKKGLSEGQILKNGEEWDDILNPCPIGSCVCIFEANELEIKNIAEKMFDAIFSNHKCKPGEKIFLLELVNLDDEEIGIDNSAGEGWENARKYYEDILIKKNVIAKGYLLNKEFIPYENPQKVEDILE
jgi:hypothetical protein